MIRCCPRCGAQMIQHMIPRWGIVFTDYYCTVCGYDTLKNERYTTDYRTEVKKEIPKGCEGCKCGACHNCCTSEGKVPDGWKVKTWEEQE